MAEHLTTTPSGFEILFEDGEPDETGKRKKRTYTVNGEKLPSVTTVLGMLDKPGLVYWSEKLTVEGCLHLAKKGALPTEVESTLKALYAEELRHFQVKEQKGKRGTLSHEDLVHLAAGRELPPLDDYAPEQRGFAMGVAAAIADLRPHILASELAVASVKHGYAGRLDLHAELGAKTLPDGTPAPRGRGLFDLKTHDKLPRNAPTKTCPEGPIKTPWPEALIQVGLYEVAGRESGYPETDYQAVLRVDAEGNWDFCVSWLSPDDCLDLLPGYRLFKRVSPRVKRPGDQRPVGFENAALEVIA